MYKRKGTLVYQTVDQSGPIEVVDTDGERALHFGSHPRQSSILLDRPNHLNSLYAQAMMGFLLFNESPQDILMIGLGGGTITKYLLQQFENCQINVVEYRKAVLKVARSYFQLPLDPRLKVHIGCGGDYIKCQSKQQQEKHDLIVVDAYDHQGMAPEVSSESFFDGCQTLLTNHGLLAINLWGTQKELFEQVTWNMGRVFNWKILFLPVRKRGNIIGFAFNEQSPVYSMKTLRIKASRLEQKYHFQFSMFVRDLKRHNTPVLSRLFK